MKKLTLLLIALLCLGAPFFGSSAPATNPKPAAPPPARPAIRHGSFTDPRDGNAYRTVKIGNRTWMADNLNYKTSNSLCYDNDSSYCDKYGRLYTWDAAMKICPAGWRLPTDGDWDDLMTAVGGDKAAGTQLKSQTGWISCGPTGSGSDYLCADTYGFSALPGGGRFSSGSFGNVTNIGHWWSATENGASNARSRYMSFRNGSVLKNWFVKTIALSVRCVME